MEKFFCESKNACGRKYVCRTGRFGSGRVSRPAAYLLLAALVLCLLTGCQGIDPTLPLDEAAVEYLEAMETADAAAAAAALNSIEAERKASAEASAAESRSIEESVAAESLSIAAEEYAKYLASSAAESASVEESLVVESIQESLVSGGEPSGVLEPGKVSTLMESEIPKLRSLFADTIVIGNSRARSILDSGILTENEVVFQWAATVDEMTDVTLQAAKLYRGKTLFILGVNDLGYYTSRVNDFKRDYIALIDSYREINPDSDIYLQEIIPINEAYRYRWYNMDRVTDYNAAIREICEEKDCTFVSSVVYALPEFLSDDTGAHYDRRYHIYWAQTIANKMGLWEGWE